MAKQAPIEGLPLVTDSTRAQSENVETVITRLRKKRLIIPDYQRDAEQWDSRKESLFIESLLNNLTVPAFFFSTIDDQMIEVVDGQQRLSTIWKYVDDKFPISDDDSMVYLTPQSSYYRGKKFSELHSKLQAVFNDYPLTIIYLPQSIDLGTKLEIFRRINEGGTPLTSQDIRLAYYSESKSVTFIRLAGLHGNSPAAQRMLASAEERSITNPWAGQEDSFELWCEWWEGKLKARGQIPSEMFLWYLVTRYRDQLNSILSAPDQMKHLPLTFRGSTEEALDVYCAQIKWAEENIKKPPIFPITKNLRAEFNSFALWIKSILSRGMSGISVDKYKQVALMTAALVEHDILPEKISDDAWDALAEFIRTPRQAGKKWLRRLGYPEQKGRWSGENGQYSQCSRACELVGKILNKHP